MYFQPWYKTALLLQRRGTECVIFLTDFAAAVITFVFLLLQGHGGRVMV